MFKVGGGYSQLDTGGIEVTCPLCLGEGFTKNLAEALKDIKEITAMDAVNDNKEIYNVEKRGKGRPKK